MCVASPSMAGPLNIVVPNNLATSIGNDTDHNNGSSADPAIRFQEIFGSGQFVSVGGSLLIDQFAWRAKPGSGPMNISIATVDIYLSTTQYFPNPFTDPALLMSSTFADNVGPDNTHVYSGPDLLFRSGLRRQWDDAVFVRLRGQLHDAVSVQPGKRQALDGFRRQRVQRQSAAAGSTRWISAATCRARTVRSRASLAMPTARRATSSRAVTSPGLGTLS